LHIFCDFWCLFWAFLLFWSFFCRRWRSFFLSLATQ